MAEPAAKPRAGRRNAEAATAPATFVVRDIIRRRVTVSPSKAPGMLRSAVYFDCCCLRGSATARRTLSPGGGRGAPTFTAGGPPGAPPRRSGAAPPALRRLVVSGRTRGDRRGAGVPYR